eukprot:CAMPEP_0197930984 /NCGR_PEP_ID=MMETSP1439-20131203/106355_1 /TAXON_ID=66791 /ORGANISM="Gonyaulax spinifera, Strain CCMP409" /LENGTH=46 /DNA_ID= /DNA_START= /DNA_END= /DNA_ORIENTATION=
MRSSRGSSVTRPKPLEPAMQQSSSSSLEPKSESSKSNHRGTQRVSR